MKKSTAVKKLCNAITYIGKQKMSLKYSDAEHERWKALHAAQVILDKAFWSTLRS
jgi:hypothetical protein